MSGQLVAHHMNDPTLQAAAGLQALGVGMRQDLKTADDYIQQIKSLLGSSKQAGEDVKEVLDIINKFDGNVQEAKTTFTLHEKSLKGLTYRCSQAISHRNSTQLVDSTGKLDYEAKENVFETIKNQLQNIRNEIQVEITALGNTIAKLTGLTPSDESVSAVVGRMEKVIDVFPGAEVIKELMTRLRLAEQKLNTAREQEFNYAKQLAQKVSQQESAEEQAVLLKVWKSGAEKSAAQMQAEWQKMVREAQERDKVAANTVNQISCTYRFLGIPIFNYGKNTNDGDVAQQRATKFREAAAKAREDAEMQKKDQATLERDYQAKKIEADGLRKEIEKGGQQLQRLEEETKKAEKERDACLKEEENMKKQFQGASLALAARFSESLKKVCSMYGDYSAQKGGMLAEYMNFLKALDEKIEVVTALRFRSIGSNLLDKAKRLVVPMMLASVPAQVEITQTYCTEAGRILSAQ